MTTLIKIPNSTSIKGARGFLKETDWSLDTEEVVIRFHQSWVHLQPWIVAALGAWGLAAQDHNIKITIENPARASYAWRFGLHNYLGIEPPAALTEHEETGRFVPLRTIGPQDSEGHARLMADVVSLLHLSGEPEQAKAVQYVLSEMVRNVREHSGSVKGAVVCAQWYQGKHGGRYVSIGIADTGIGIRNHLSSNYPDLDTDASAILRSLEAGVTGSKSGMYGSTSNAGAGLFYTRRLAQSSLHYFAIGSGDAMFRTSLAKKQKPDSDLVFPISPYPGTMVSVNLAFHPEALFDLFLESIGQEFTELDDLTRRRVREGVSFT